MENILIFNGNTLRGDAKLLQELFRQSDIINQKGTVVKHMIDNKIDMWYNAKWTNEFGTEVKASLKLVESVRACGVQVELDPIITIDKGETNAQIRAFIPFSERKLEAFSKVKIEEETAAARAGSQAKHFSDQAKEHRDEAKRMADRIKLRGEFQDVNQTLDMKIMNQYVAYYLDGELIHLEEADEALLKSHFPMRVIDNHKVYFSESSKEIVRVVELSDGQLDMLDEVGPITFLDGEQITTEEQRKLYNKYMKNRGSRHQDYEGKRLQVSGETTEELEVSVRASEPAPNIARKLKESIGGV